MLLDVGVSATKITDEDYDDPSDTFTVYPDQSFEDLENLLDEYIEEDNNNEASVNFNSDVSKIAINDILNEMRMGSPIENDLLNDLLNDEANNNIHAFNNANLEDSLNRNSCNDKNCNQNNDFKDRNVEDVTSDNNFLDQLLDSDACSTPDVEVDFNDFIQFQYNVTEQLNCDPNITLSYFNQSGDKTVSIQDSGLKFDNNLGNNYESTNQLNFEFEPHLKEPELPSNNQYFECSTNLPMTPEELQADIQKYLNSEQNYSYASFYEYADMINDTVGNQNGTTIDHPYSSEMLQEYISQQNLLVQSLDSLNPIVSFETPKTPEEIGPSETYQCKHCPFVSHSLQGFGVHMGVHSDENLSCTECNFTTTKARSLRLHQAYGHGNAYSCQACDYVTHSSSKIKSHMRKEH